MRFLNLLILISFLIYSCNLFADETNKLTICSLNLYRLGEKGFKNESPEFLSQRKYLADRIIDGDCDIIALQELVGKKKSKSAAVLHNLINYIHTKSQHRLYKFLLGESNDSWNRNAFIYDSEFLNYKNFKSWNKQTLIKDDIRSAPWSHTRGPISVFFNFKKNKFEIFYWTNINAPLSRNVLHSHKNSIFSAVYYIQGTDTGALRLINPANTLGDCNRLSPFTRDFYFNPKDRDLILWPAWVPHEVEINESARERINIVFDIKLKES
jgi:hypothetical protein